MPLPLLSQGLDDRPPLPLISRSGSGSGELWFNIRILEDVESPTISRAKEELTNKVFKTQSVRFLTFNIPFTRQTLY